MDAIFAEILSEKLAEQCIRLAMAIDTPRPHKALRWLRNSGIVLVASYVVLVLFVQVSERVMRHRAERLLTEMRELQVGRSTWADLQGIMMRWGAWGDYQGTCSAERCEYQVSLADVPGDWRFAVPVSFIGHGHLASAFLNVTVSNGIVKQTSFSLWLQVPKGYGARWEREEKQDAGYVPYSSGEYTLMARASSYLELEHLCCYWPNQVPHPTYVLTKPSGCEGCLSIRTEFVPKASSTEKVRMTNFNLNCITRWKPCSDEEDIMPEAGAEYEQERRARIVQDNRLDHCAYSVDELSNAALDAAVVQVESIPNQGSGSQQNFTLRLVKRLGGAATWHSGESVSIDALMEGPQGRILAEAFRDRKPVIVLYWQGPDANRVEPYTCGLLPYGEQTEAQVIAGVSLGNGIAEYE